MGEVVNVIVAFAVIVFLFRWVTSSNESPGDRSATDALGFRPKNVTQDMVDTIHGMFPDIPSDNIRFDLLRTGNIELTSNKILERGFLDPPPAAFYTLYPRSNQAAPDPAPATRVASNTPSASQANLITRYNLQSRLTSSSTSTLDEQIGGKAVWEDSPEKREASLRERKAQMILAARQRLVAQQQQAGVQGSSKKF